MFEPGKSGSGLRSTLRDLLLLRTHLDKRIVNRIGHWPDLPRKLFRLIGMISHSHMVTFELYLRVSKIWISRKILTNSENLLGVETSVKILVDYGDARNPRTIELHGNELFIRVGGDVSAY